MSTLVRLLIPGHACTADEADVLRAEVTRLDRVASDLRTALALALPLAQAQPLVQAQAQAQPPAPTPPAA